MADIKLLAQGAAAITSLADDVAAAIAETELPEPAREALQRFFNLPDLAQKLLRIEADAGPAGAGDLTVALHPTDLFRMLPAAIRAGDIDGLIVE